MAHRLHQYAAAVAQVPGELMERATGRIGELAELEARRATGDGRMSGMGRRAPRLRTVARVRSSSSSSSAEVVGVPAGGWAILEGGARPHVIGAGGRRPAGVLMGPGMRHPVRGPVRHPGAPAKGSWSKVAAAGAEETRELALELVAEALR